MKSGKNILVVTYWGYNSPILNSYALPYIRIIKKNLPAESRIFLFTLTPAGNDVKAFEKAEKIFAAEGIILINSHYRRFGFVMALKFFYILNRLLFFSIKNKIDVIHAWCTPGGAIGYVLSLFTGKKLVLDSFEPHAQSMVETRTWKAGSLAFKLLFKLEKLQLKKASNVICTTNGMINYSQKTYGVVKPRYFVKPACVDLELFRKKKKNFSLVDGIDENSLVCVYVGKFGDIYLSQEVFDFFKVASTFWGEKFKVLLLTNHTDKEIDKFCQASGLGRSVVITLFVPHTSVPEYMSLGDFGICPVRPVPTKEFCTPIKNGEYWSMGLPVVITKNISDDSRIIEENNIGYVLKHLNENEYLNAAKKIDELISIPHTGEKIRKIAEVYRNYEIAEKIYHEIYFNK